MRGKAGQAKTTTTAAPKIWEIWIFVQLRASGLPAARPRANSRQDAWTWNSSASTLHAWARSQVMTHGWTSSGTTPKMLLHCTQLC